jgi:ribosomal-protein-alanine N-acetyltransferase
MIDPATLLPAAPLLVTPRLRLRALDADDATALFRVFSDDEAMRFWSTPPHASPAATAEMLAHILANFAAGAGVEWAIARGDDVAVGKIGLWRWQRTHSRAEVGFILRRDLWRQGLAAEALAAVVRFGFGHLQLHSIEAQLDVDNVGSTRTLERVGFRREGLQRQSFFDGREHRDTLLYGLLASDLDAT